MCAEKTLQYWRCDFLSAALAGRIFPAAVCLHCGTMKHPKWNFYVLQMLKAVTAIFLHFTMSPATIKSCCSLNTYCLQSSDPFSASHVVWTSPVSPSPYQLCLPLWAFSFATQPCPEPCNSRALCWTTATGETPEPKNELTGQNVY